MSTSPEGSLSFDRAADHYDETRGDSDEIARSVELLAEALGESRSCLEIGVGTGRIALPLKDLGFDIVGIDLSMRMMDKLRDKYEGALPLPLVQADASQLCFDSDAFEAAYAIWVLHLIGRWKLVLEELLRTVRPGGPIVIAFGGNFGKGPWQEIINKFRAISGAANVGAQNVGEIDEAMRDLGCKVERLDDLHRVHEVTAAEVLKRLDAATYSFTWVVDERARKEAVAATRRWAQERFGDLEAPLTNEFSAAWRRYLTPG